jgi:tagaturonate epimerase
MRIHPFYTTEELLNRFEGEIYPESLSFLDNSAYFILRVAAKKQLAVLLPSDKVSESAFQGEAVDFGQGFTLLTCPMNLANCKALRKVFSHLTPVPLGLETSEGSGDRLGMATPGHVRALKTVTAKPGARKILPIFAQQSMRENNRTRRTPEQVMSDATWGTFQAGWLGPVGADADHLKTTADIDLCAEAEYSFYTIDPGEYVDSAADTTLGAALMQKVEALPWNDLETTLSDLLQQHSGITIPLEGATMCMTQEDLLRAAAKYGKAVAHIARMYRHLLSKGVVFELEVSVDETDTPTRLLEHFYVASELKRLGIQWVSLAPRFVGRFEKGVDYIGDLKALEKDLEGHAAIARLLGPYKLSLHSGSDKFSAYPLACKTCRGLVHLKTAGTSYLEALRVVAVTDPTLFRKILALGCEFYETDRKTYHVSADLKKVPKPGQISDAQLPDLLDQFDARQVFHVTFGTALGHFGAGLQSNLQENEEIYYQGLEKHFVRHLLPFANIF